jgi:transaldolase
VNTVPEATLRAFADHGSADQAFSVAGGPKSILMRAEGTGTEVEGVAAELEREGVRSFCGSYGEILACIEAKAERVARDAERSASRAAGAANRHS